VSTTHEDIVREVFRGWAAGDFRSATHFDESVIYVVRPDFPEFGVLVGLKEIEAFMHRFLQQWEHVVFKANDLEVFGDTVLVGVTQHSTGAMSGVEGDVQMFMLFTFRGRKIVRMETVLREADARAVLDL
jgi:ketosteroid isomerase-like protein